ncbi:MAG: transposase [Phycisphaerales bacterium]|nr:transposase [Phycisphaerales bacterium]
MPDYAQLLLLLFIMSPGGWLLFTARKRGEGDDPHCLMCGYNLTGLSSERCPECGETLDADMILKGSPSEMRWNRFWIGALLVLVPAAWVVLHYFLN